jgi:hypothetical protein
MAPPLWGTGESSLTHKEPTCVQLVYNGRLKLWLQSAHLFHLLVIHICHLLCILLEGDGEGPGA